MAKPAILNADEIAAKFSESLRVLSKLTGFSERVVTLAEAGIVLKTCAGRTKVAKPDKIEMRTRGRVLKTLGLTSGAQTVTINSGQRGQPGRVWALVGGNEKTSAKRTGKRSSFQLAGQMSDDAQKFTPTKYHLTDTRWAQVRDATSEYGTALRRALPIAKQSAGLARQAWIQIADELGIILEDIPGAGASAAAIKKARASIASDGKLYQNGAGMTEYQEAKSFVVTLINRLPYWQKIKMDSVLLGVIAGRVGKYEQSVARAVFASHAETVKAYPWLKLLGAEP